MLTTILPNVQNNGKTQQEGGGVGGRKRVAGWRPGDAAGTVGTALGGLVAGGGGKTDGGLVSVAAVAEAEATEVATVARLFASKLNQVRW